LQHEVKLGAGEGKSLKFEATIPNILNQKSVTAYITQIDSGVVTSFIAPGACSTTVNKVTYTGCTTNEGGAFFAAAMHPYDWKTALNTPNYVTGSAVTLNSNYGKPLYYQFGRTIRLGVRFTF
jgi:hypothetical protein